MRAPAKQFSFGVQRGGRASVFGELLCQEVDLYVPGRGLNFAWVRTYRSRTGEPTAIGNNWDYSYRIFVDGNGEQITVHDGAGRQDAYSVQPNGLFARKALSMKGPWSMTCSRYIPG